MSQFAFAEIEYDLLQWFASFDSRLPNLFVAYAGIGLAADLSKVCP